MSLDDKAQSYLSRGFKMILMFAILGCIILVIAVNYLTSVFTSALPTDPSATQNQSSSTPGH